MLSRFVAVLVCLWTLPVLAQTDTGDAASKEAAKAADESEAPQPPAPPVPPPNVDLPEPKTSDAAAEAFDSPEGDISLEEWNRDDWLLLKPQHSLIELDGYFRLRGDLFRKLDFSNGTGLERSLNPAASATAIEPRYDGDVVGEANFNSTNMRLRLEPTINVSDRIQIVTTLDVLDNLVLGSTPNTLPPQGGGTPLNVLSDSQDAPRAGVNALQDSFVIKRAYARVTALNEQLELRFGRMPNHWGLGMMANDGDCLDCDYGDVADRLALTFRAAGHLFTPMFDWVSSGPVTAPFGRTGGQPIDAFDRDDAVQYSLRVAKVDHPEDVKDKLAQGDSVLNYGAWGIIRTQNEELIEDYYYPVDANDDPLPFDPAAPIDVESNRLKSRDAFLATLNAYGKLFYGKLELAAEGAFIWGTFNEYIGADTNSEKTTVYKLGGALEATYRLSGEQSGVILDLKAGGASGDSAPGFGALDRASTQRAALGARTDRELQNFQFSPDYHVDLLMFRRIIGTVTDAWYVRPGLTYMFDDKFAGSVAAIWSQALFKRSVPGNSRLMGIEIDGEVSYGLEGPDPGPFAAAIVGGLAYPFGAFDNLALADDKQGGSFAWTFQARLYLTF